MQYPKKIHIGFQEGTCPLKCKKCPAFGEYAKEKKKVRKMPLERAKMLIDEISEMEEIPAIQPHIFTEPFANEDLKIIIPYCCKKEIPVNIITNGILLNDAWMDLLIREMDRKSTISFSLDAITQKTYEKVRGEYSLEELEHKVKYLVDNRDGQGPRVTVNFTYEEDNYDEKDLFLERWKDNVDAVRITVGLDSNKKVPAVYRNKEIRKSGICPYLLETMTIDAGGEVRICCLDAFGETYLGNVFEEGIMPLWIDGKMKKARQMQGTGQLTKNDFCFECEWAYSTYNFDRIEEQDDFVVKIADYATYFNRK